MQSPGSLVPRSASALTTWSRSLAQRMLSEIVVAEPPALVVTSTCPDALEFARLEGPGCIQTSNFEDAWDLIAKGDLGLLVIGSDFPDWPPPEVRALTAYRIPVIRCGGTRAVQFCERPYLETEPGGWLTAMYSKERESNPAIDDFDHATLRARMRRLGRLFRTEEMRSLGNRDTDELVVRGGRILVFALHELQEVLLRGAELFGHEALTSSVDEATESLDRGEIDAILFHSCCVWKLGSKGLGGALGSASRNGVPVITQCGCREETFEHSLQGVTSLIPEMPLDVHTVQQSLDFALLERKAWLLHEGRSSDRLVVSVKKQAPA